VTSQGADPSPPIPVAVAFSGGGFRASLAGLGVVRFLAQSGLLRDLRYVSSVSGGSWAGALLALNWAELEERGFTLDAVDDLMVRPFVTRVTTTSLQGRILRNLWRTLGPKTRTDLLADAFNEWFGREDGTLGNLPDGCRFMFNSTNLRDGNRFVFEKERVGVALEDHAVEVGGPPEHIQAPRIRVADALGASAAMPGGLSAQRLVRPYRSEFKMGRRPQLVDGAVYDNLGTEPFRDFRNHFPLIISLDAGAVLRYEKKLKTDLIGVLKRSNSVMMSQATRLRRRWMVERFRRWEDWELREPDQYAAFGADPEAAAAAFEAWDVDRVGPRPPFPPPEAARGVSFGLDSSTQAGLASSVGPQRYDVSTGPPMVPPWSRFDPEAFVQSVADMPMSVKKLDLTLCRGVIYRSWWLSRAFLTTYHADVVAEVGGWTEWYRGS